MTATVAALFVSRKGPYWGDPRCDCWDEKRDARNYDGTLPVLAHPPCGRWCQLAGLVQWKYGYEVGDDGGCFEAALEHVRRCGGVLEHPAHTKAWRAFGLTAPSTAGWQRCLDGTWVCECSQVAYGHEARKRTWLLFIGREPLPLCWDEPPATTVISGGPGRRCRLPGQVSKARTSRTPEDFASALVDLASVGHPL